MVENEVHIVRVHVQASNLIGSHGSHGTQPIVISFKLKQVRFATPAMQKWIEHFLLNDL